MEHELALEYSHGRTETLEDLTQLETQNLIATYKEPSAYDKMKRKILSLAHEMRWELPNGKVDMARLNAWCKKHTPSHKPFDRLTEKELPVVVSLFEKVYHSFLKAI